MNFIETFKEGQLGKHQGLRMGSDRLDEILLGIQKKAIYGVAASPKVGKSTLVDFSFLLAPYMLSMTYNPNFNNDPNIEWIYFSYEVDRVEKEFKIAAAFFFIDYQISEFVHPDTNKTYEMSSNYLMGRLKDKETKKLIPVTEEHIELLKNIYENRIKPLFGEFDKNNIQIEKGLITFMDERDNPTGIYKFLNRYAEDNGEFVIQDIPYIEYDDSGKPVQHIRHKRVGYRPNNPDKHVIIITDHIRKLKRERGFTMKENIDKLIEYQVDLRNLCHWTFVDIAHLNRSISAIDRIKHLSEFLYPTGDDLKDTGNLSEEANYILTMFNPQDEKYNIPKHFGLDITAPEFKNYRSIHLVEARGVECPKIAQTIMTGGINWFSDITKEQVIEANKKGKGDSAAVYGYQEE